VTGVAAPPGAGRLVGRPLLRREDDRILRGESRYLDDIERPRMAHLAFVRSVHARARVTAVRRPPPGTPGLVAVLTAEDLSGRARPLPVRGLAGMTVTGTPHPLLAADEVGYVGQPVAAVLAESRALAEDAAELVEVHYEVEDAVVDARASTERVMTWQGGAGDVEAAFAAAAHVVRAAHHVPRLAAVPMETRGAIAEFDPARDLLTVWCSAQDSARPLAQLAHALDRPADAIRVIVPDVGGAFGSKGGASPEVVVAAVAAMAAGRPVKWAEDRMENFLAAYQGRGIDGDVELALDGDGRILAVRARIVADLGAYLYPHTPVPAHTTGMLMCGCYAVPAAAVEVVGMRTNKVPVGPYRGAGRPEAAFLLERTVDAAARRLGIDAVELRRRNLVRAFPHRTPLGWTYDSGDYVRCLELAAELVEPERGVDGERLVGTGFAMYVERAGGQWESADVSVEPDGRVVVASGSSPHGQGHDTTFAQIVADELGADIDRVVLRFGDSAVVPPGVGTFASRSVAMGGSAIVRACAAIRDQARALAAEQLGGAAEELTFAAGRFSAPDGRELPLREVAAAQGGLRARARFESDLVFSSGTYGAVVDVDPATGAVTVRRMSAVDDAGRIVNPLLAEGQVLGATVQGLGAVLTEEVAYDELGQLTTATLLDYGLLTAAELPHVATAFVESHSPLNPLGAKGIGEGGAVGAPAAVANAVTDALGGRQVDPPFTPEKVWSALHEERG
jgi:aerobic carbon-monoxide dehydrogenase large subunit